MIYKLTDSVWWGDRHVVAEHANEVCSVLNVAHNPELAPGKTRYNPLVLPGDTPYIRVGRHDSHAFDDVYMQDLADSVSICLRHVPVLVHCYVGSHRSPIVAVYVAFRMSKGTMKDLHDLMGKMVSLKPDFRVDEYHKSLYRHMVEIAK